jgi:hypothetical protein
MRCGIADGVQREDGTVEADHFDRTLRAFQKRSPFKPFVVALVNGDRVQVDHPEALVVRGGLAVFVAHNGTPTIFDHEGASEFVGEPLPREQG